MAPLWVAGRSDGSVERGVAFVVGGARDGANEGSRRGGGAGAAQGDEEEEAGFVVRMGDLRGASGGRGVLVEVEWTGGEDEELVRTFWRGLDVKIDEGRSGKGREMGVGKEEVVKEVVVVGKAGDGDEWEGKRVSAWMEVLRAR